MKTFNKDNLLEKNPDSTKVFERFKLYDALHATEDIPLMITGSTKWKGTVVTYNGRCDASHIYFDYNDTVSVTLGISASDVDKNTFGLCNESKNIHVDLYDYIKTTHEYRFNDNICEILWCMCKYTEDCGSYQKNLIVWISDELNEDGEIVVYEFIDHEPVKFCISTNDLRSRPITIVPLINPYYDIQDMTQEQFENMYIAYDKPDKDIKPMYKFDIKGKDYIKPGAIITKFKDNVGIRVGTIREISEDYMMIDWINSKCHLEHEGVNPSSYAARDHKFSITESIISGYDEYNGLPKFEDTVHDLEIVLREDETK